jgi:hypothetical protein
MLLPSMDADGVAPRANNVLRSASIGTVAIGWAACGQRSEVNYVVGLSLVWCFEAIVVD